MGLTVYERAELLRLVGVECAQGGGPALPLITLGVTLAATAASTAVGIHSQQQQANYAAAQARNNASLARQQRADVMQRGAEQAAKAAQEGRRVEAAARAAGSETNIDTTTGSFANLLGGIEAGATADAERIRASAIRAGWGLANEEQDYRARGAQARTAGVLGSVGQGLAGIGQAAGQVGGFAAANPGYFR